MFESARVKLTFWYSLIIVALSLFFTLIIYHQVDYQLRHRHLKRLSNFTTTSHRPDLTEEYIEYIERQLQINLALFNFMVLLGGMGVSYFLAGRTLKPIEEVMKEQKRFISDASHELMNPLSILKTSSEVVLRNKKVSTQILKDTLKSKLETVNHIQELINNLLFLSSREEIKDIKTKFELVKLIKITHKKIGVLAKQKEIKLNIKTPKKCCVLADKIAIERLLIIILDNAIKYTNKGGNIDLTLECKKRSVILKVKDTGIGIDKKDLRHIFNRFWRADKSRDHTQPSSGFGLGLSLAKKIVLNHKGTIKVQSKKNQGSTFTIKLPILIK